ncbi:MAG: Na+/H+ antiporter NhaA [Chloroflexota bacterium]
MAKPVHESLMPRAPIQCITDPLRSFLNIEAASGAVLLVATVAALALANSQLSSWFLALWKTPLEFTFGSFGMRHSLQHWINDGLMAIFFFVVGLEVKRELVMGELRNPRVAALPIVAAVGGMVVPALVYLAVLQDAPGDSGWGIPMATDIAFVVGCLAVLGSRVPVGLRVMVLSLAIADDIGAIIVIAIGYTANLNLAALALGLAGIASGFSLMRVGVRSLAVYLVLAVFVWACIHESGIHATIAGVVFGLVTPAKAWVSETRLGSIVDRTVHFMRGEGWTTSDHRYAIMRELEVATRKSLSPLERFETELHPWVGFVIVPLFALANAGVAVRASEFGSPVALAVALGLIVGKPLGIILSSWLAVRTGLASLPEGVGWGAIAGSGLLCGIGFTMAMFVASLALDASLLDPAKIGVMIGSAVSALIGFAILHFSLPRRDEQVEEQMICER